MVVCVCHGGRLTWITVNLRDTHHPTPRIRNLKINSASQTRPGRLVAAAAGGTSARLSLRPVEAGRVELQPTAAPHPGTGSRRTNPGSTSPCQATGFRPPDDPPTSISACTQEPSIHRMSLWAWAWVAAVSTRYRYRHWYRFRYFQPVPSSHPFICLPPPLPSHHLACVSCVRALLLLHVQHDQAQTRETARAPGQRRLDGWVGFHV